MNASRHPPREVPWRSWDEWLRAKTMLFSPNPVDRAAGVQIVDTWRRRGRIPHAADLTGQLVEIALGDPGAANYVAGFGMYGPGNGGLPAPRSETELRLLYSVAVMRGVNGLVDAEQQGMYAVPISTLARVVGLPLWIVDLRHDAAHKELPALPPLRLAAECLLSYFAQHYWAAQHEHLAFLHDAFCRLLAAYKTASGGLPLSAAEAVPAMEATAVSGGGDWGGGDGSRIGMSAATASGAGGEPSGMTATGRSGAGRAGRKKRARPATAAEASPLPPPWRGQSATTQSNGGAGGTSASNAAGSAAAAVEKRAQEILQTTTPTIVGDIVLPLLTTGVPGIQADGFLLPRASAKLRADDAGAAALVAQWMPLLRAFQTNYVGFRAALLVRLVESAIAGPPPPLPPPPSQQAPPPPPQQQQQQQQEEEEQAGPGPNTASAGGAVPGSATAPTTADRVEADLTGEPIGDAGAPPSAQNCGTPDSAAPDEVFDVGKTRAFFLGAWIRHLLSPAWLTAPAATSSETPITAMSATIENVTAAVPVGATVSPSDATAANGGGSTAREEGSGSGGAACAPAAVLRAAHLPVSELLERCAAAASQAGSAEAAISTRAVWEALAAAAPDLAAAHAASPPMGRATSVADGGGSESGTTAAPLPVPAMEVVVSVAAAALAASATTAAAPAPAVPKSRLPLPRVPLTLEEMERALFAPPLQPPPHAPVPGEMNSAAPAQAQSAKRATTAKAAVRADGGAVTTGLTPAGAAPLLLSPHIASAATVPAGTVGWQRCESWTPCALGTLPGWSTSPLALSGGWMT
ncbi:unnamed protein product [Phaeothamnion confervicola]